MWIQHFFGPPFTTALDAHATKSSPGGLCARTHTQDTFSSWWGGKSFTVRRARCGNVCRHVCAGPCSKYKIITVFVPVPTAADSRQTVPVHSMHTVPAHSRQTMLVHSRQTGPVHSRQTGPIHSRKIEPVRSTQQQADWACPQQADGFVFLALSSTYVRTW